MPRFTSGNFISSLNFNGTSGRLQIQGINQTTLLPTQYLTVSSWIQTPGPITPGGAMVIFARDDNSTGTLWNLSVSAGGFITFKLRNTGGTVATATSSIKVTDNKWYFVMGTWDGTTITIFINGVSVGTQALTGTINQSIAAYASLGIRVGTSEWYNGLMTQPALHNTPFTLQMHKDAYFRNLSFSEFLLWKHDSTRDLVVGNSTFVHDVGNLFTTNSIVTVTGTLEAPPHDNKRFLPTTKSLVSSNAKGSSIFNTASYGDSYLITFNGNQYVTFADTSLNVMVGKRATGSNTWSIIDTGFNIIEDDDHNNTAIGIDSDGFIHIAWGHHGTALQYARSNSAENISAFTIRAMVGTDETSVSYPKFFNANGKLFFAYRDGGSISGDEFLNKYNTSGTTWSRVAKLVDGKTSSFGTYPDSYISDSNNRIHHAFCWRVDDNPSILYEDYTYMYSDDEGATWYNSQGVQYTLPVTPAQAGDIIAGDISLFWPQNHLAVDSQNRPHIAYGKASNRIARDNYFHAYLNNGVWQHTQITDFTNTISSLATFGNYKYSRPSIVVNTQTDRVYVIGRIWEGNYLRIFTSTYPYTTFESFKLGNNPEGWGRMEMGGLDKALWRDSKTLNIAADSGFTANPDSLYVLQSALPYMQNGKSLATGRSLVSGRLLQRDMGTSLKFNGTSALVSLTQTIGLPLYANTSYSVSGWIFPTTLGTNCIWGEGRSSNGNPLVEFCVVQNSGAKQFRFQIRNDSGVFQLQDKFSTTRVIENKWTHFSLVDNNGDVHLYINGAEDAATIANGWDYTRSTLTLNISTIGALVRTTTSNYFNGFIDHVKLFSRAISSAEARNLYLSDLISTSSQVGVYKFDEETGTVANDSSGNLNTGTITAASYSNDVPIGARTLS